jgi:putative addiction module CopG family antidote
MIGRLLPGFDPREDAGHRVCDHEVDDPKKVAYRTSMTINLKPELEQLIQKDIARGAYQSVEEYVERAVQMLHDEEDLLQENKDAIHQEIGRGLAELDRGEGIPGDVSRARLQEKKAEWLKRQRPAS